MNRRKISSGTTVTGMILIVLGILWVLSNLDVFDFDLSQWWPLILIVIGLIQLFSTGKLFNTGAWILIALGVVFLLTTHDYLHWHDIWKYWPVVLIVIGISIIVQRHGKNMPESSSADEIAGSALFGGVEKKINSKQFKGGSISALFGGAEIDLRDSELDQGGAVIDISTIFGGTEIRIPKSWALDVHSTAILGGFDNKTSNEMKSEGRRLIIKSTTIFGGTEIKN